MPLGTTTRHRALTDEPGIKYVAVGRSFDRVILATYSCKPEGSAATQSLHAVIMRILCSTGAIDQHPRLTITDRQVGTVHYDTERSFVFFCVTEGDYPQRLAFKCIAALKADFIKQFGDNAEKSACVPLRTARRRPLPRCPRTLPCTHGRPCAADLFSLGIDSQGEWTDQTRPPADGGGLRRLCRREQARAHRWHQPAGAAHTDAARPRVARAVLRLRSLDARRGVQPPPEPDASGARGDRDHEWLDQ